MNHFPSINAISASICLLGCGLALPVFSQQPEKGKPDAAHISKTGCQSRRHRAAAAQGIDLLGQIVRKYTEQ